MAVRSEDPTAQEMEIPILLSLLQKCQGGGPGLPYMGSVGATAPTYSMDAFFKMTFAKGSIKKISVYYG